jgi:rare lipoprotein A
MLLTTRAHIAKLAVVLGLAGSAVVPAHALAGNGGASAPDSSAPAAAGPTPAPATGPAGPVGTSALQTDPVALLGHVLRLRGNLGSAGANRSLLIERYDTATATWMTATTTTTDGNGAFAASWRTDHIGVTQLRVSYAAASGRAQSTDAQPTVDVTIYRPGYATWYGPGFYGQKTACGVLLTHHTLGVAHPTLPCGTPVQIVYAGRSITVPVIDRGPYGGRAHWDLTEATAHALAFDGNQLIGALRATQAR